MARKPAPKTTTPPALATARDLQVAIAAAEARITTVIDSQKTDMLRFLEAARANTEELKTLFATTTKARADDTVRHIVKAIDQWGKALEDAVEAQDDDKPKKPPVLEMLTALHEILHLVHSDTKALMAMGEGLQRRLAQIELSLEHVRSRLPAPGPAPKNPKVKKNKRH
jgi:hypothetical protein